MSDFMIPLMTLQHVWSAFQPMVNGRVLQTLVCLADSQAQH